jgi:hypothetical protein
MVTERWRRSGGSDSRLVIGRHPAHLEPDRRWRGRARLIDSAGRTDEAFGLAAR